MFLPQNQCSWLGIHQMTQMNSRKKQDVVVVEIPISQKTETYENDACRQILEIRLIKLW